MGGYYNKIFEDQAHFAKVVLIAATPNLSTLPSGRSNGVKAKRKCLIHQSPSILVLLRISEVMLRFNEIKDSAPAEYWCLANPGLMPAVEVPA
jgi:hypothetical protein